MPTDEYKTYVSVQFMEWARGNLQRISTLRESIESKRALLDIGGYKIMEYVSTSHVHDSMEKRIAEIDELIAEYANELKDYLNFEKQAHKALSQIDAEQASVLIAYYLQGKRYTDIAKQSFTSNRTVYNLRSRGLVALYEHIPQQWRIDNKFPQAIPMDRPL